MAEVDFGGSKVKKIVEAAQEASEAAQELSYRLATTGSGMFEQALETSRLTFKAEQLFRMLDHRNREKFWNETGLGVSLQQVLKICLDFISRLRKPITLV